MMNRVVGAYVEITEKCNERCPYCYNEQLMRQSKEMPWNTVVDVAEQLQNLGIQAFTLSGGEPFLHSSIDRILQATEKRDIKMSIISNGACFLPQNQALLLEYAPSLQLTFDGFDAKTHDITRGKGNFERLINGYEDVRRQGYSGQIAVRINLHKSNIQMLRNILCMIEQVFDVDNETAHISTINLAFLHKANVEDTRFSEYIHPNEYGNQIIITKNVEEWNSKHKIQLHDISSEPDIGCPFNEKTKGVDCGIRVAINGDVFPCQLFSGDEFTIGNIYDARIQDIINSEKMKRFLSLIHNRRSKLQKCQTCAFGGVCGGGCPGQAFVSYGTVDAITERCADRKRKLGKALNMAFDTAMVQHHDQ